MPDFKFWLTVVLFTNCNFGYCPYRQYIRFHWKIMYMVRNWRLLLPY